MAPCCRVIARLLKSANSLASPRTREAADAQLQPCASLRGTARPAAGDQRLRGARQQRQGQLLLPGTGGRLRADLGNRWPGNRHCRGQRRRPPRTRKSAVEGKRVSGRVAVGWLRRMTKNNKAKK